MHVYIPVWFSVKKEQSFINGAKHFYKMVSKTQALDNETKNVTNKVFERNAFFAHPENLLVAMVHDENVVVRKLGWRRIKKAREQREDGTIRSFMLPGLNFEAKSYYELIDWQNCQLTEPPALQTVSGTTIDELIASGDTMQPELAQFPCHTQAVERAVKLVTEAAVQVSDHKERDGLIRNKLQSRQKMPKFETKRDYFQ